MNRIPRARSWWRVGLGITALTASVAFLAVRVREAVKPPPPPPISPGFASPVVNPASDAALPPDRAVPWANSPPPEGPAMAIEPAALVEAGRERDDNVLRMKFRWCPPGRFHRGRLPDSLRRDQDMAPVAATLREGFWMGRFEVTQAQWLQIMGLTLRQQRARDPRQPRPLGDGSMRDHVGEGPDHPIYFTSFDEAEEFCRKLTALEREAGRLEPGWEYRLPDEAQWEYACRAGTTTATAFGDSLAATQANFDGGKPFGGAPAGPYLRETTPVGRYPANAWGLHDFHGNLWEWCRDVDAGDPTTRPAPARSPSETLRPIRGGCWHNDGTSCLSTSRGRSPADARGSGLGFRVALVAAEPPGQPAR